MPNIVGITKDDRLRGDLERICLEAGGEDLRFAGFGNTKEFEALYFRPRQLEKEKPEEAESTGPPEDSTEPEIFEDIQIILIAEDALSEEKPRDTAVRYLQQTKAHGYWPEEGRTRIIVLRFEEDSFDKTSLIHPAIDDLIFLPLDQPVLMQKLEIFLNLPQLTKPSFLFYQDTNEEIEISKIVVLEKLNDCALAIRNKVPLRPGVRGKFYLVPPGTKEPIRFFGKAFRCEPHPEIPGEHLVYFFFFGIRKKEVSIIRRWLSSNSNYQSLKDEDQSHFSINEDDMFLTEEEKKSLSVVIIDHDPEHTENLVDFLERKMDRLQISRFESFAMFYEMGLSAGGSDAFTPNPSDSSHLPEGGLKLLCDPESKALKKVTPEPNENSRFCEHPMESFFIDGQSQWWSLFDLKQNEVLFREAAKAPVGSSLKKVLFARDPSGNWIGFETLFERIEEGLSLDFQPIGAEQLMTGTASMKKLDSLSTLIIDARYVSENFDSWLTALLEQAKSSGAIQKPEDLKIILMAEDEDHLDEAWLKSDNVIGFVLKPTDQKTMAVILAEALQNKNTVYTFSNLGWIEPNLRVHLSKPVQLAQLGEFGATINTSTPFKEGSFFFLRKGIFDEAPNGCLSARVYKTEAHPSDEGRYLVYTTYFGINDYFLKHARSHMRESYAATKGKSE